MNQPQGTALGQLARWLASADKRHSQEAQTRARHCFIDTIACLLAGHDQPAARAARRFVAERGDGVATVVGGGTADPLWAALCNGTSAHAQDFDDYDAPSVAHVGAVLVPCILAVAEQEHSSGAAVLDALLMGYEVMVRVGEAVNMDHYLRGWHATATLGTLGAAASAARLLSLDEIQSAHALSLASSMASGFKYQFGTMAKPLHAGLAAKSGLLAAGLAKSGITASDQMFEGAQGLLAIWRGGGGGDHAQRLSMDHASLAIERYGLYIKRYPCCGYISRAIDGIIALREQHRFHAKDIGSIQVLVPEPNLQVLPFAVPIDPMQARFSMHYCAAVAATTGRLGLADFTPEALQRDAITALQTCVTLSGYAVATDARDCAPEDPDTVEIHLRDGTHLRQVVAEAAGSPGAPLSSLALYEKFLDCARPHLSQNVIETLWHDLNHLRALPDAGALLQALRYLASPL